MKRKRYGCASSKQKKGSFIMAVDENTLREKLIEVEKEFGDNPNKWLLGRVTMSMSNLDDEVALRLIDAVSWLNVRTVSDDACKKVLSIQKSLKNPVLVALCDVLLASNHKNRGESKLVDKCHELWKDLVLVWQRQKQERASRHAFSTVLRYTISKFPESRENLAKEIYGDMMSPKFNNLAAYETLQMFVKDKVLINLFDEQEYVNLINAKFNLKTLSPNELKYFNALEAFDAYLIKPKNFKDKSVAIQKICDLVFTNYNGFSDYFKHDKLQQIRDYMDALGTYDDAQYVMVNDEISRVGKRAFLRLKDKRFYFSPEMQDKYSKEKVQVIQNLKTMDALNKAYYLLSSITPINKQQLKESVAEKISKRTSQPKHLDGQGILINYKALDDSQQFSLDATEDIYEQIIYAMRLYLYPFLESTKGTDYSKVRFIGDLRGSEFIDPTLVDYREMLIQKFFSGEFDYSVKSLVLEFEDDLRTYLHKHGYNIYKTDRSGKKIDINSVFSNKPNNRFRDFLLGSIGEDYYFTLTWLLTDRYGFDLRDKISHALPKDPLLCSSFNAIYAALLIIKLYMSKTSPVAKEKTQ